ncbi:leucine-rich repeat and calponin homology domain-containing protein isoform X2 [Tribolium madens]|uniref:leucine-rich repeat and calponin homology domain-containing protein isoform X2 n=1 Tax=Tribolium madens TaxID=41895 RepID=UPI001CF72B79|nr:leucine-rich repeat and calponin homology domain-containing protein isoform X2 [Tribolium madens]
MAMLVQNINGHIQNQLTRSLEKILDDANQSGELKLSNRKLKDFPKTSEKYNLRDTVVADLSKNRFSELPEEVTTFHFLEKLQCYHNAIRYIPDSIINLQCLIYVDLSRNQLTSLPRELCQLPIKILLVSNNNLTQLPDELNRMSHLMELDASCNQLTHLPPRMGDLRSLQSLVLRNNLLLAVPIEVTFLKLVRLDLRANRIGTLPIEIRDMATLIELHVEDNPLTSPPASLCRRGRVHIFKYLDNEAMRLDRKTGGGTLGRKSRKSGAGSSPGPPLMVDRLKHKRQNVDSGYSTSSDGFEKRWSQDMEEKSWMSTPLSTNGTHSILSTPSTASPAPENDDDVESPSEGCNGNNEEEKVVKPLHQIQTYKEYKDALKQQRAHDVPAIYRTKNPDDQTTYKTEPNTPTHHAHGSLATSKSDPTPLNAVLSGAKYVFDDTKKPEKTSPYKTQNGNKYIQDYVKPKSPVKVKTGILSHDNVPGCNGSPRLYINGANDNKGLNGVKTNRTISWNKDVPVEKMTFTMRREIDKAREETDLINQLRNIIETRLKMTLPEDLAPALTDGVVLCHLANHIKPRSVASIHVPSPAVPKLTMARCRRNVDNFIEACRKIGVDENVVCCAADVLEGRGLVQIAITVTELLRFHSPRSPLHNPISTVI